MQAWGLIVLLVSKAAGHAPTVPDMEQDKSAGVLHSQRGLAEIIEMIRISFLIHQVGDPWRFVINLSDLLRNPLSYNLHFCLQSIEREFSLSLAHLLIVLSPLF